MVQENSPGRDGHEYILRCRAVSSAIPKNMTIPSYDLPFLFYNGKSVVAHFIAEIECSWSFIITGFPPIREIREFRENFEDFFQSGKSGKNRGFSAKIREKNFKTGNFFSKPFSNLLNL